MPRHPHPEHPKNGRPIGGEGPRPLNGWIVLALIAASACPAPGQTARQQIPALVEEFRAEQQGADAALARELAEEAARIVSARVTVATTNDPAAWAERLDRVSAAVEESFSQPGWKPDRVRQLTADVSELARTAVGQAGLQLQTDLQSDLRTLAHKYLGRRNREFVARIGAYAGRLRGVMAADLEGGRARARAQVDRAIADFRARLAASVEQAKQKAAASRPAFPRRR